MPTVRHLTFRRFERRDLVPLVNLEADAEPSSVAWRWSEFADWVRTPAHRLWVLASPDRSGAAVHAYVAFVEHKDHVLVKRTGGSRSAQAFVLDGLCEFAEQSGRSVLVDQFGLMEDCPHEQ
jgi:hypothetical protein